MEIIIPTKLSEVPLYQMVEYNSLPDLPETERGLKAVSIFLNLTKEEITKIPVAVINKAIGHIKVFLSESPNLQNIIEHRGVKYGFIPNLDDLTTGEFVDIEAYQKEPKDLYKLLSVLYRPITKMEGKRYLITPYKGEINEDFRDLPSDVAFGALLFFYRIGSDLIAYTLKCLHQKKGVQMKINSPKNGAGWDLSISSLEAMLLNFDKLLNFPFTPVLCGVLTNQTWRIWKDKLLTKNDE